MIQYLWDNLFKKEEQEKSISHILGSNYIFENLSKSELNFVEDIVHVRNYRPGEIIFRQGEVGVGMYIIMSGKVDINIEDSLASTEDNDSTFVTRLEKGDFFGEISLVEQNSRRTATASACTEVTLLGFFKPDLNEIIDRHPLSGIKIMTRLAEVIGKRLKETAQRVTELKKELGQLEKS